MKNIWQKCLKEPRGEEVKLKEFKPNYLKSMPIAFFTPNKFPYVYWPEGFTFQHIVLLIAYLSFVALLIYWVIRLLNKFESLRPPLYNKKFIFNFFTKAYNEKIFFEGYIPVPGRLAFWDIRAVLVAIDEKTKVLTLKTNIVRNGQPGFGEVKYVDALIKREFRGRIEVNGSLYEFRSTVLELDEKKHQLYLKIHIPKFIVETTKRFQSRLLIDDKLDLAGVLWLDVASNQLPYTIDDIMSMNNKFIAYKKNKIKQFTLVDLSPRGMKLRFNEQELKLKKINLEKNATCLFSLSFVQLASRKVTRLWLLLECRHIQKDNTDILAGFFIQKYAKHPTAAFDWILNESEYGIDEIQDWIIEIRKSQEESMQ